MKMHRKMIKTFWLEAR